MIEDRGLSAAELEVGSRDYAETRELAWESELDRSLAELGKTTADAEGTSKSAGWKVAVAALPKSRHLAANGWIGERLRMGSDSGISRYVTELRCGKRNSAKRLLSALTDRIKV